MGKSICDAMPSHKVRTVIKAIPDSVRIRSADSKCAQWTKTGYSYKLYGDDGHVKGHAHINASEYRVDDNGQLVKRFTDGYGDDPWQLLPKRGVEAFVPERPAYVPSGKPAKAWRKGDERPLVVDKLGRKTVFKP